MLDQIPDQALTRVSDTTKIKTPQTWISLVPSLYKRETNDRAGRQQERLSIMDPSVQIITYQHVYIQLVYEVLWRDGLRSLRFTLRYG